MLYGYARVSTIGQSYEAQLEQLKAAGAQKIFSEKKTGIHAQRPQLQRAIAALDKGDVLMVTRIDRVARTPRDMLNIAHDIEQVGAHFRSLAEPWANTDTIEGEMLLTMRAVYAKLEHSLLLARTAEGRALAKAKGKSLGRRFKLSPAQKAEVEKMLTEGRSQYEIADVFGVGQSTISRVKIDMERSRP